MSNDKEMLGSYGPKKESYVCTTPRRGWEEAPSGAMVRGKFKAKSTFSDDDKQKHLEYEYAFASTLFKFLVLLFFLAKSELCSCQGVGIKGSCIVLFNSRSG